MTPSSIRDAQNERGKLMRKRYSIPIAAIALSAFAASGSADATSADVTLLTAKLTAKYVNAPATGFGTARITFTGDRVCWKFTYRGIGKPTISGIHKAPPPPAGKHKTALIPFVANTSTKKQCLITPNHRAVELVTTNPGAYYVSIGTSGKWRFAAIGGVLHPA
jgi:CHRD domain